MALVYLIRARDVDDDVDVRAPDEGDVGGRILDGAGDGDDFLAGELGGFLRGAGEAVDSVAGAQEGAG